MLSLKSTQNRTKNEEVEQVAEADSLAAMAARREKRLAVQRKREGTTGAAGMTLVMIMAFLMLSVRRDKTKNLMLSLVVVKRLRKKKIEVTEKKKDDTYLEPDNEETSSK